MEREWKEAGQHTGLYVDGAYVGQVVACDDAGYRSTLRGGHKPRWHASFGKAQWRLLRLVERQRAQR